MDQDHIKKYSELPTVLKIKRIVQENPTVRTFYFDYELGSKPGQFVMLWLPGVDEIPISIAYDNGKEFALTICKVGSMTEKIFELIEGDQLGIRGPYGTYFNFKAGDKIALVAGGYGAAPLYNLAHEAVAAGCEVDFIIGARSKDNLVYIERLEVLDNVHLHIATNDGSAGFKGYTTVILADLLKEKKIDHIMSCGPEMMMKAVGKIGDDAGVNTQLSVERYMKCGFGVCGQCTLDPLGIRTCVSGPVMNNKILNMLEEFGSYHRDDVGKKQYF
ncbi:dihydroorotate dehydrogenase electron transfer subunit [Patescibacteria group bacterium]|nr:dihydroorotate dehydrogenase electron transfer subunit [Patescibacteria group bacterium]